jgi:hypothetical protein
MTRRRWAAVLAIYGVAAIVAMVFTGPQIPNCFGSVPNGEMSPACIAAWQASRSTLDQLLGTPSGALLLFLALAGGTWVAARLVSLRRHS